MLSRGMEECSLIQEKMDSHAHRSLIYRNFEENTNEVTNKKPVEDFSFFSNYQ
jgi:hypothetical protein